MLECIEIASSIDVPGAELVKVRPLGVFIVLDQSFGDRLLPLLRQAPVWLIDSSENQLAAEERWKQDPSNNFLEGVTLFQANTSSSLEDVLISELPTIEEHHGGASEPVHYRILDVIGIEHSPGLAAALFQYSFADIKITPDGFRATRP